MGILFNLLHERAEVSIRRLKVNPGSCGWGGCGVVAEAWWVSGHRLRVLCSKPFPSPPAKAALAIATLVFHCLRGLDVSRAVHLAVEDFVIPNSSLSHRRWPPFLRPPGTESGSSYYDSNSRIVLGQCRWHTDGGGSSADGEPGSGEMRPLYVACAAPPGSSVS
ncbi:Protein of unknown function [Gryllus bimaculatus]|nr:Protein of unknown function [Gryllus bimaculatus]